MHEMCYDDLISLLFFGIAYTKKYDTIQRPAFSFLNVRKFVRKVVSRMKA